MYTSTYRRTTHRLWHRSHALNTPTPLPAWMCLNTITSMKCRHGAPHCTHSEEPPQQSDSILHTRDMFANCTVTLCIAPPATPLSPLHIAKHLPTHMHTVRMHATAEWHHDTQPASLTAGVTLALHTLSYANGNTQPPRAAMRLATHYPEAGSTQPPCFTHSSQHAHDHNECKCIQAPSSLCEQQTQATRANVACKGVSCGQHHIAGP